MSYTVALVDPAGYDAYGKDGLRSREACDREVPGLIAYARSQARFTGNGMATYRIAIDQHHGGCHGECTTELGLGPDCRAVAEWPLAPDPELG